MDARTLGRAGLVSSALGLGGMAFSGVYGPVDAETCARTIRHAMELGITLLDLSGRGSNDRVERLVGRAIAGRRDGALLGVLARPGSREKGLGGREQGLARACDAALRRLSVERIDLYYLDCVTWPRTIEEGVGELTDLVTAGKVGHIGLAEPSVEQIHRAAAEQKIAAITCEYSLRARGAELAELPAARAHGIGVIACRPLGRGLLTGSAADLRSAQEMAADLHLGLGRLALVWLLAQGRDIVPVPSTRSRVHLEMNATAAGIAVDPARLARLGTLFPPR